MVNIHWNLFIGTRNMGPCAIPLSCNNPLSTLPTTRVFDVYLGTHRPGAIYRAVFPKLCSLEPNGSSRHSQQFADKVLSIRTQASEVFFSVKVSNELV